MDAASNHAIRKGIWYYQYNAFDEITDQYKVMLDSGNTALNGTLAQALANSSVKMQRSHVDYDRRGRVITQADHRETGALEGSASWNYDTAANGIGELASETGGGLTRTFSYQAYGTTNFTVSAMHQDGNGSYLLTATFDAFGRVKSTTDALGSGSGMQQSYNAYGYPLAVSDLAAGTIISQAQSMDALGNITGALLGNGATSTNIFDQGSGLPTRQSAMLGTLKLQDLSYSWDLLGNQTSRRDQGVLSQRNNTYKDLKQYFCYDGLNRLTKTYSGVLSGNCAGTSQQDQQYDSFGNITSKTGVGTYSYSSAHPQQVSATSDGITYTYDTVGNLISDTSSRTLHYTVFDKPDVIAKASYQISFAYGPDHDYYKRVDNNNGAVTTTYKIGNVEKVIKPDGNYDMKRYLGGIAIWNHHFTSAGAQTSVDKQYLYTDALGSLVLVTDGIGTVQHQYAYDAWGRRVDSADWSTALSTSPFLPVSQQPTTQGFTGQDMLDAVGLIHYGGRIYDQKLGRFVQADPGVPYPKNLQSHNRYSYVRNNPLGRVDPTGYEDFDYVTNPAFQGEGILDGGTERVFVMDGDSIVVGPLDDDSAGISMPTTREYTFGATDTGLPPTNYGTKDANHSGGGGTFTNTSYGPTKAVNSTPNTSVSRSSGAGTGGTGGPGSGGNGTKDPGSPPPGLTKPASTLGTGGPTGLSQNALGQGIPNVMISGGGLNVSTISSNFIGGLVGGASPVPTDILNSAFGIDSESTSYTTGLAIGIIGGLFLGSTELKTGVSGVKGAASLYVDITKSGSSVVNRATNLNRVQFEENLIASGFKRSMSKDGKGVILDKNGSKYVIRNDAKSTQGPTADFYKSGSQKPDLKIRLEESLE